MRLKKKEIRLIILLLVIIIAINYSWLDNLIIKSLSDFEFVEIERIIDGDTVVVNGTSIRLLGINSPERGEKYYQEAKDFLEEKVLNKTVRLEYGKDKTDRYGRILAYIFLNGENINLKEVEEGLANYYFPSGKDFHYNEFGIAWGSCIEENKYLCEKSEDICGECIELKELDYNSQEVIFYNNCNYDCNLKGWEIKDEGRKNFVFPDVSLEKGKEIKIKVGEGEDSSNILFWVGETYVWTRTGDTLFLRDNKWGLILWKSY